MLLWWGMHENSNVDAFKLWTCLEPCYILKLTGMVILVSTVIAPEQRIQLVQFPRICEATDPRCFPRKRCGTRFAPDSRADPEGAEGTPDDEGMR